MNQKLSAYIKSTLFYVTGLFPFVFSIAICLNFDVLTALLFSVISIFFMPEMNFKRIMPLIISFLIIGLNPERSFSASIICCGMMIISSFFTDKIKKLFASPLLSGIMLAGALTVTVLFTTDYFGIGATGNNVAEMIKSYISLGFHPNWRGVLYGTIVLVIMVTFPRKFKKADKYISSSFIALVFTLVLSLLLNPADMNTAVNEISTIKSSDISHFLSSGKEFIFDYNTILIAVALFILYFYSVTSNENNKKADLVSCGIGNIVSSGLFRVPVPYSFINPSSAYLPRISAAIIILSVYFLFEDLIARIPIHSCAVIVIVTAWNNVQWGEIKKQFGNILSFACFMISVISALTSNMVIGIIISFAVSTLYSKLKSIKA